MCLSNSSQMNISMFFLYVPCPYFVLTSSVLEEKIVLFQIFLQIPMVSEHAFLQYPFKFTSKILSNVIEPTISRGSRTENKLHRTAGRAENSCTYGNLQGLLACIKNWVNVCSFRVRGFCSSVIL